MNVLGIEVPRYFLGTGTSISDFNVNQSTVEEFADEADAEEERAVEKHIKRELS